MSFDDPARLTATIVVLAIMLLVAFPFHEFAHALAAYRLGDGTAKLFGRLTLDPRAHFDPAGGTLLILSMLFSGGFAFGWAKPTPVNPMNLRGGRQGDAIVAFAGPASNLVLAAAAALPYRYIQATGMDVPAIVLLTIQLFVSINIALMIFNLIPIPPLDGSHILLALVDPQTSWRLKATLEQYGPMLLLGLIFLPPILGLPSPLGIIFDVTAIPIIRFLLGLP